MKIVKQIIYWIITFALLAYSQKVNAQELSESRQLHSFSKLSLSGNISARLIQDGESYFEFNAAEQPPLSLKQNNNRLAIHSSEYYEIIIHCENINHIEMAGAARLQSSDTLYCDELKIETSGASYVRLLLRAEDVIVSSSGASSVALIGSTEDLLVNNSGATTFTAKHFLANDATVKMSGTSKVMVNADELSISASGMSVARVAANELTIASTGASAVYYQDIPGMEKEIRTSGGSRVVKVKNQTAENTQATTDTEVANDSLQPMDERITNSEWDDFSWSELYEDMDEIQREMRELRKELNENFGDGNKLTAFRKKKFDGHWSGFELGINAYGEDNFNTVMPRGYNNMEQSFSNSIAVNLNLFDISQAFGASRVGFVSGVGFSWNNFVFNDPRTLLNKADGILNVEPDSDQDRHYRKSKLTAMWVRVPLLIEFQADKSRSYMKDFYVAGGVVGSAKMSSHTKQKYNYDGNKKKQKDFGDFYLNPFRADLEFRIGFGPVRLFANYSLIPLFQKNKGPELYPWTIGLTLVNF